MKINSTMGEALARAISWYGRETDVDIYEINSPLDNGVRVYGVNWKAMGTKTPGEAKRYAKALLDGSQVAIELNSLEITVDRSELGELENIKDDDIRLAVFRRVVEYIYKALEDGSADRIRYELMRAEENALEAEEMA